LSTASQLASKVVIKSLQGSAVTQTVLDGQLLYILRLPISYSAYVSKNMKIGWQ